MAYLVLVDHFRLLHLLNGHHLVGLTAPTDPDLSEGSSADDGERYVVSDCDLGSLESVVLTLLMENFLFYEFLLLLGQVHLVHLPHQLLPGFSALSLLILGFGVFVLNVSLGTLGLLLGPAGELLHRFQ
jgi:hypothetical protein